MSDEPEIQELPPQRLEALRDLGKNLEPPHRLETAILDRLERRGLVERARGAALGGRALRRALAGIAAVLLFVTGLGVGVGIQRSRQPEGGGATEPGELRWILLLHGGDVVSAPEEMERVERIVGWLVGLRRDGVAIDGERLEDEAWWVEGSSEGGFRTDGGASSSGRLSGYFLVDGVDREEVLTIARSSPFLDMGGSIEVRPIGLPE